MTLVFGSDSPHLMSYFWLVLSFILDIIVGFRGETIFNVGLLVGG